MCAPAAAAKQQPSAADPGAGLPAWAGAEHYRVLGVLGKGTYGTVLHAQDTWTGQEVAIKCIRDSLGTREDALTVMRELRMMRLLLGSRNVVQAVSALVPPGEAELQAGAVCVVMQLEAQMSLAAALAQLPGGMNAPKAAVVAREMLLGLRDIHGVGGAHRDLAPGNVLLGMDARGDVRAWICDFGMAVGGGRAQAVLSDCWTGHYVVTRWYRAPEVSGALWELRTAADYQAVDLWGLGCIVAEMLLGRPLLPGRNTAEQLVHAVRLLGRPPARVLAKVVDPAVRLDLDSMPSEPTPGCGLRERLGAAGAPPEALDFLSRLLAFDPRERAPADALLRHPFVCPGGAGAGAGAGACWAKGPPPLPPSPFALGDRAAAAAFDFEARPLGLQAMVRKVHRELRALQRGARVCLPSADECGLGHHQHPGRAGGGGGGGGWGGGKRACAPGV